MIPERKDILQAFADHIVSLFGRTAQLHNKKIWGFKEVRLTAEAGIFLQDCFPKARFIHLTRHPVDCYISLKKWEYDRGYWNENKTKQWREDWVQINRSFIECGYKLNKLLSLRYEGIVNPPIQTISLLADFLNLKQEDFDEEVFHTHLHGMDTPDRIDKRPVLTVEDLTEEDLLFLKHTSLEEIALLYEYKIPG